MKKTIIGICLVLLLFACFEQNNVIEAEQSVAIQFSKPASIDVVEAQCRVSAEDLDTILADLTVTPTLISGTIPNVPYGEDRLFEIMCYNSSGHMNYYGFSLIDINSLAPVVNIVLNPVDSLANVTINGTFANTDETEVKIVFVADWSGNYDTYIMDSDGTNIKQLTFSHYDDNCPELSPDRQKVVFQRQSGVGHQGYIVDVNTLEETMLPLVDYEPHTFSWNSDGTKMLFTSWINGFSDIFEYDIETDSVRSVISDSACIWVPIYTSNDDKIIYYSNITGTFRAYIANIDGSDQTILSSQNNVEERCPRSNPVNDNIVVFAGRGYDNESFNKYGIFFLDRSTGNIQKVISHAAINETWPKWSPDGQSILYQYFDGKYNIYTVNADGTQNMPLLNTTGNVCYPHWR